MTMGTPSEILDLLQSKNRCLDRLLDATRAFLQAPLESFVVEGENQASSLTRYEEERSTIVRTIELHDRKITSLISQVDASEKTPEFLDQVKDLLAQNERLIVTVCNADDVVFSRIREAQGQITRLLQENRKSRELLSKFKSGTVATGEGMDQTL